MQPGGIRRGPPLGRHLAAISVVLVLILLFRWGRLNSNVEWQRTVWNLVLADTSFVLLCLILMLGPVGRFLPRMRRYVPWGRELGIGMFVTAGLHVVLLLERGDWNVLRFFFEEGTDNISFRKTGLELIKQDLWAAVNWVGLFALAFALVLAATSNDFAQRQLGRGWKFVQRQTYTLFVVTWLHTAGFLILIYLRPVFRWFWVFTTLALVAQFAGFVHTVRSPRGPSPQRAPEKTRAFDSTATAIAVAKGVAVTALWGGLIIGVYLLDPSQG